MIYSRKEVILFENSSSQQYTSRVVQIGSVYLSVILKNSEIMIKK